MIITVGESVCNYFPNTRYKSPVGECTLKMPWHPRCQTAEIWNLRVRKRLQNKGFGQKMLNEIFQFLKDKGVNYVALGCYRDNDRAMHVYRKLGFQPYYSVLQTDSEHMWLRKKLA